MYNLLIATHGTLAEALKETLKMFTSNVDDVYTVGLTEAGVEDFNIKVLETIDKCYEENKGLLVLVDLFGGTPFNTSMLKIKNKYENVEILTGVNLPLLIEATLMKDNDLSSVIEDLKSIAKESIIMPEKPEIDDDDE